MQLSKSIWIVNQMIQTNMQAKETWAVKWRLDLVVVGVVGVKDMDAADLEGPMSVVGGSGSSKDGSCDR